MKKFFYPIMAFAIAAFTLTACEDVPEPYEIPSGADTEEPVEGEYINESFATSFGDFTVHTVTGTPWVIDFSTAKASGYDNDAQVTTPSESYLVSPAIDLTSATSVNISFEYIEGESILMLLDMFNICASSGSACTTGSLEPSHVLRAMGLPYTAAHGTIRFSLSKYNTETEIDRVIEVIPPIIGQLRAISPYWNERRRAVGEERNA